MSADGVRAHVIGVGQSARGDDGAGPAVIEALRGTLGADVSASCVADGAHLVDVLPGCERVVLVDATCSGMPVGTVRTIAREQIDEAALSPASTHTLGVAEALGVLDALGVLPAHVVLVGVEGADFTRGAPLHPDVQDAIPAACAAVHEALAALAAPRDDAKPIGGA